MRVLIAEDDIFFQKVLQQILAPEHDVITVSNGVDAWKILQSPDAPHLAILDWVMPGLSGPQICRKVRASAALSWMYLIILTSKNNEMDIVSGLRAGADDYITKPPIPAELRVRVSVGVRILALQKALAAESILANQAVERPTILHDSITSCSARKEIHGQGLCHESEPCSREKCEPKDCCSLPGPGADPLASCLLTVSQEKSNPDF